MWFGGTEVENFVFICFCPLLSLSLNKISCISAKQFQTSLIVLHSICIIFVLKDVIFRFMATINEIQDEIIEEFSGLTDWMDKYSYIIEMGNALPPLDEKYKTPDNLIEGCQSRVWVNATYADGVIRFDADSDAIIVKGIISMLVRVLSGQTPSAILDANLYFIDEIGLKEHLSPTRSNGLLAMVKQIKMYAVAYKAKEEQK